MNRNPAYKFLIFGLAIGFFVHSVNSFSLAQTERKTGNRFGNKKSKARNPIVKFVQKNIQRVTPASYQSNEEQLDDEQLDGKQLDGKQLDGEQLDAAAAEQQSLVPQNVDKQITSEAREITQSSAATWSANNQESIGQNEVHATAPMVQYRDDYDKHFRALRPMGSQRFSADVGTNLQGTFSSPSPRMAASEMVVNQATKIAMLEQVILNYQAENGALKKELTLTVNALTQSNLAFQELQTQMTSVKQQNLGLRIKFEELAETYSRSETEIQQMLDQLRKYVSKELNAANVSSGSRSPNQLVEPGALPNSELLPSPKN